MNSSFRKIEKFTDVAEKFSDATNVAEKLNETNDAVFKETYCKDITPILIKNLNEHVMYVTVTNGLEITRLNREHDQIDEKSSNLEKKLQKIKKDQEEVVRNVYKASEIKNQSKVRLKRTGEIIRALKDESVIMKNYAKKLENKRLEITKSVNYLIESKNNSSESKKKIDSLENDLKEIMNSAPAVLNSDLVQEREILRKEVERKADELQLMQIEKQKKTHIKKDIFSLLSKINLHQGLNFVIKEEIESKKKKLELSTTSMKLKLNDMLERIDAKIVEKNDLAHTLSELFKISSTKQLSVENLNLQIAETEKKLEDVRKDINARQESIKNEKEKFEKQLENEKEKLNKVDVMLEKLLEENIRNSNILFEKTQSLNSLKTQKEELLIDLCHRKIKLISENHEHREQQSKFEDLMKKIQKEKEAIYSLKMKNEQLEIQYKEIEKRRDEYPKEIEKRSMRMLTDHNNTVEELLKNRKDVKAALEASQNKLDNGLKELEILKKDIKDIQESNEWAKMKYEMRKSTVENLREKLKKEEASYEKLVEKIKQKEAERIEKQEKRNLAKKESRAVKSGRSMKDLQSLSVEIIENEDDEEKAAASGRKSPGILKTPLKETKRPQTPTKRVTFEGLSPAGSSMSLEGSRQATQEESMDQFLKDWGNTSFGSNKSSKKIPMDF